MHRDDLDILLPLENEFDEIERAEIAERRSFARRVPRGGWVAIDQRNGRPCFMMWIIDHENRAGLAQLEGTPRMKRHQLATENVYVPPEYRGRRISTPASLMAMERARGDATEVVAFIGETNLVSRQGAARSGFRPYIRHVRWHLLFGLVHIDLFDRRVPLPLAAADSAGGGGSGIRTHGGVAPTPVFKTGALNRSAIPPAKSP